MVKRRFTPVTPLAPATPPPSVPAAPPLPSPGPPLPHPHASTDQVSVVSRQETQVRVVVHLYLSDLAFVSSARLSLSSPELLAELKDSGTRPLRRVPAQNGLTTIFSGRGRGGQVSEGEALLAMEQQLQVLTPVCFLPGLRRPLRTASQSHGSILRLQPSGQLMPVLMLA